MANHGKYLAVILALAGAIFFMGLFYPFIFQIVEERQTQQLLQDGDTEYVLNGELMTEAAQITNSDAVITLSDDAQSENHTITVGGTQTYNVSGDEVNVTLDSASNSANEVEVTYTYPPFAGYPERVRLAGTYIPLLLVLLGLVTVLGLFYEVM